MTEALAYLAAAVVAIAALVAITPPGTSVVALVVVAIALVVVLSAIRHGPGEVVAVLEALSKLWRR